MGEIADMMLDGTLCADCGVYLDMESVGYPAYCGSCEPSDYSGPSLTDTPPATQKERCPICGARKRNVLEHAKAVHPKRWKEARDHAE